MCYHMRFQSGICCGLCNVDINLIHHCSFFHIDFQTAKQIDDLTNSVKIYCHIICNIQIQILIQHTYCLFRPSVIISIICFPKITVFVRPDIQIRIPIHRCNFDLFCIVIDTGNHNHVTIAGGKNTAFFIIKAKYSNICISFQHFLRRLPQIFINDILCFDIINMVDTLIF